MAFMTDMKVTTGLTVITIRPIKMASTFIQKQQMKPMAMQMSTS